MPDAAYFKNQVRRDAGDIGINAVFELTFPVGTTGGTWLLAFANQSSAAITYPALPGIVQTALESVPTIGAGNVDVTFRTRGYALEFIGDLAGQPLPLPVVTPSLTPSGSIAVQIERNGKKPYYTAVRLDEMWERRSALADIELRYLWMRYDVLIELQGLGWPQINQQDGDNHRDYAKQFDHLESLLNRTVAEIDERVDGQQSDGYAAAGGAAFGTLNHKTPDGTAYRFPMTQRGIAGRVYGC